MATVDIQTLLSSNLPLGFTGSIGYTGSQGFTGSQGEKGDRYKTTSSTTLTISSSGTKTFTIETELGYSINQTIKVSYDTGNYMIMNITSYNSNTGVMQADVLSSVGSGAYSSWIVNLEGAVGEIGYTGSQGFTGSSGAFAAVGFTGSKGDFGYTGSAGSTGFVGSQGPAGGFTGSAGFTGSQGYTGSGSSVGGSNTQIQYNNNGVFGGSANLTWSQPTTTLTVTGNIYFPNEASASYPGGYKSAFTLSDGFLESNFTATGGNLYFGAGFGSSPAAVANMYIGDAMNFQPGNSRQANIYIGGANNDSQIYLRGVTNFPLEANPGYPAAYRSTFFDASGVFESTFGATGGNLYFGAGFGSSPAAVANMYIGDAMNFQPGNSRQANIYIGGANNDSQIYLRGTSYHKNESYFESEISASYPGIWKSMHASGTDGRAESIFPATGGTLYVGAGFASGPAFSANLYIGDAMNFQPANSRPANIYIGGADNNSQIYLRGVTNFPNEANPGYPGAYRSAFFDASGVFESTFGATGGNLYIGAGFAPSAPVAANLYIGDAMNFNAPGSRQANIYIGGADNNSQIYLRGNIYFPNEASASYPGIWKSMHASGTDGVAESVFTATGGNLYIGAGFNTSPAAAANLYIGDAMNFNAPGSRQASIYIGGANNDSQIYLRGNSYHKNESYFESEISASYPGIWKSMHASGTDGRAESIFTATGGNLYFGAGFAPSPGVLANMYIGDVMNFNAAGSRPANIYIGGADNNSQIYLRGVTNFPNEANPGYPAAYRSAFFDASGVFESTFGATGGNLYIGAGFAPSAPVAANMYIGDVMNFNAPGSRQANIYIGGVDNNSQIYLRGVTNFPLEAAPAAYPGAYRSAFFDASGVFESTFGATGGNLYFGAGFSTSSAQPANMYIGDAMNFNAPGSRPASIYIGGVDNNSQIYLRGVTNFPNEANPAYPGAYRSTFFDASGVFESTFGATGGTLYFGAGFSTSSAQPANMYIGDAMNFNAPGSRQANIYIGGANNNSQIYLRGFGTVAPLGGVGNRAVYSDASGVLTNSSSDRTVKTNIRSITYGLEEILQLVPVIYNWIDVERLGSQDEIGLIANDVELIMPELVSINKDGTKSLDYPKIVAPLIKAIQQITDRLSTLENK